MRDWTQEELFVWYESGLRCFLKSGIPRKSAEDRMDRLTEALLPKQTGQPLSAAKFAVGTLEGPKPSRFDIHGKPR